jgi:phage terminase large subunit GpA-like protein
MQQYTGHLDYILDSTRIYISDLEPSVWFEQNMVMPRGSAFPGPFSFDLTPYWREPLDCMSKTHPARKVSIMKGAQTGCSASVLTPAVGYTISQNPGNILFLTGHSDLTQEAVVKIDYMIDNCGLRPLIRPNTLRAKNSRTGDTNTSKEYPGGDMKSGSVTNHNLLRQRDVMVCIVDDFDAAKQGEQSTGSTRMLVEQRLAAYAHKMKLYYVSSPQLKGLSNIEEVFKLGDQRYYNIPCPCCGHLIVLKWTVDLENGEKAGITWKQDEFGKLIDGSVGYICQECAGFFDDSHKYELNLAGMWVPSCAAEEKNHWSYQLSSLYAPPGMYDWEHYVSKYLQANPPGEAQNVHLYQSFVNVVLGETFEDKGEDIDASELQKNIRSYNIGIVPDSLSQKDGNGHIVLLTCACDLNGLVDDARLDYEVLGHSENGSTYSIIHGSIGTFLPRGKNKDEAREKWTYDHDKPNSVWTEFEKIINKQWPTDTGRNMRVLVTGVDTGYCESQAFLFIDKTNVMGRGCYLIGLKGDKESQFIKHDTDIANFKVGKARPNLYLVQVNGIKDDLARMIKLKWNPQTDARQPYGFMNYPTPMDGLYMYHNYFEHYEAEHRVIEPAKEGKPAASMWKKKNSIVQNHCFDTRIYNLALKDVLMFLIGKEYKTPPITWEQYCVTITGMKK